MIRSWWGRLFRGKRCARRLGLEELERRLVPASTISISDSSVIEPSPGGTVNMDFTVTRSGDLNSQVTVGYTTVAGTAKAGTDFTPTTGTVTIASGATTGTIAIPVFGNGVYNNPNLSFSVQLTGIVDVVGPPVTVSNQTTFGLGAAPASVAVGDLNGDGKPDVVAAMLHTSVLLNTTAPGAITPSFAFPTTFATGESLDFVAIGDFNGDGKPDIAFTDRGVVGGGPGGPPSVPPSVSIMLNTTATGATTPVFSAPTTVATFSDALSMTVGDLNGDGKPDLVVGNTGSVAVLLNTTATGATIPSFAPQVSFAAGTTVYSVAIGDLNGDGKPDLAVANSHGGIGNYTAAPRFFRTMY